MNIAELLKEHVAWLLGAIASAVSYFVGKRNAKKNSMSSSDRKNFEDLMAQLPSFNQIRQFFSEKDLKNSFTPDTFDKTRDVFDQYANDVQKKFHSDNLNRAVRELWGTLEEMSGVIARETFPIHGNEQSIRRKKYGYESDDFEVGEKLNSLANQIFEQYNTLISKAKKELIL